MKISILLSSLVATVALAASVTESSPDETSILQFTVDYKIIEFPNVKANDVAEFTNGNTITLEHTAVNHEDKNVTIVGIGGTFLDATNREVKTNLTSVAVGPFILGPGESRQLRQGIPLNLVPDNYLLIPQLFVAVDDVLKSIPMRGQLAIVSDEAISIFDPQLLFLETILLGSIAAVTYIVYSIWGKSYLQGTAPITVGKKKKSASAGAPIDPSWLPQTYKSKKKKTA